MADSHSGAEVSNVDSDAELPTPPPSATDPNGVTTRHLVARSTRENEIFNTIEVLGEAPFSV